MAQAHALRRAPFPSSSSLSQASARPSAGSIGTPIRKDETEEQRREKEAREKRDLGRTQAAPARAVATPPGPFVPVERDANVGTDIRAPPPVVRAEDAPSTAPSGAGSFEEAAEAAHEPAELLVVPKLGPPAARHQHGGQPPLQPPGYHEEKQGRRRGRKQERERRKGCARRPPSAIAITPRTGTASSSLGCPLAPRLTSFSTPPARRSPPLSLTTSAQELLAGSSKCATSKTLLVRRLPRGCPPPMRPPPLPSRPRGP